jgi:hypothetical protein
MSRVFADPLPTLVVKHRGGEDSPESGELRVRVANPAV